ncbi:MAG: thioredoxin [Candidatus Diapherotrites archaeon]|nr:thioredoxin [Candidatus Diapherotrites archaeon]
MMELSEKNFDSQINSAKAAVVDFWASWCGPCRVLSPILEELSKDFKEKIEFFKVDVDQNPRLSQKFRIMAVPTVLIYKEGSIVDQFSGAYSKSVIKKKIESIFK